MMKEKSTYLSVETLHQNSRTQDPQVGADPPTHPPSVRAQGGAMIHGALCKIRRQRTFKAVHHPNGLRRGCVWGGWGGVGN